MLDKWILRCAAGLAVAALCGAPPAEAGQRAPDSIADLAAAPRIVVAEVESAESRWNAQGTLIVTDYRLRRIETLRGEFADQFVLTQGGGRVGDETHALSDLPVLRRGARYLLILNAADNPVFSSVRYGAAGALEVGADGAFLRNGLALADFRARVQRSGVIGDAALLPPAGPRDYPAARYVSGAARVSGPVQRPAQQTAVAVPAAGGDGIDAGAAGGSVDTSTPYLPNYLVQRWPAPTITFNPLPLSWVWHPSDQNMMAEWNKYGDIFRVLTTPTGDWAWRNDRYDLAGFPSEASMVAQFGSGWGPTTLAICFSRWFGSGPIVESDIAINPAYDWTLDDAFGTESASLPWSFRQSLLHELGHAWGLQHPFETQNVFWPSTMNYGPKWTRDPVLHSDDTAAIRSVYPGISVHDGSLAMYRTSDAAGSNHASYTPSFTPSAGYQHGQSITFSGAVTVQNLGTSNLVNPAVDVYLTATRMTYANQVYLGRSNYTTTVAPFPDSIGLLNLGSYLLADTVPVGSYFPAIHLASSGGSDAFSANNSAWGADDFPITIRNVPIFLAPTPVAQFSATGRIGPDGQWNYRLNAQAGYTYRFSTCGLAAFDTVVAVSGSFPTVSSDDACGSQSDLTWRSTSSQTVTVTVSGYDRADQGVFQLRYSGSNDGVFRHGFE